MVATDQPISPLAAARYRERWAIARERLDEFVRILTRIRRTTASDDSVG